MACCREFHLRKEFGKRIIEGLDHLFSLVFFLCPPSLFLGPAIGGDPEVAEAAKVLQVVHSSASKTNINYIRGHPTLSSHLGNLGYTAFVPHLLLFSSPDQRLSFQIQVVIRIGSCQFELVLRITHDMKQIGLRIRFSISVT